MFESAHYEDALLTCYEPGPVADDVWKHFMLKLKKKPINCYFAADIGSPEVNSMQRKEVFAYLAEKHIKVVVITDQKLVRGLVTAARWVGVNADAFAWADVHAAVKAAGFSSQEKIAHVASRINLLRHTLEKRRAGTINQVG